MLPLVSKTLPARIVSRPCTRRTRVNFRSRPRPEGLGMARRDCDHPQYSITVAVRQELVTQRKVANVNHKW